MATGAREAGTASPNAARRRGEGPRARSAAPSFAPAAGAAQRERQSRLVGGGVPHLADRAPADPRHRRHRTQAERRYLAASDRQRAAGRAPPHASADGGRRQFEPGDRHRHRLARHHVPLPGTPLFPMAAAAAARRSRPTSSPMPISSCSTIRGLVQTALRDLFGWRDARSYWFPRHPQPRRRASAVMSAVLYPYVYITARASFLAQSVVRARSEPHARPTAVADVLAGRPAARAPGARRGRRRSR